ncbi:MAG TPA: hypothetical protein VMH86_02575 [Rhizomicrobium sp.]|nr:hypothetical protein [Rhizomicrobium sp.]
MAETRHAARRARYKLSNSILTTYGYALIGASAIQTFVINGKLPGTVQFASVVIGLSFHAVALYNAPKGEVP